MREFHHMGLPTHEKQENEIYVEASKLWVTDPENHPYRVEFLRYEDDSPVTGPVRDLPHIAYKTDDLRREIEGKKILIEPFIPLEGLEVVFIEEDGAVIEYMQFGERGSISG
jgi:hypothetical protein